MIHLRLLGEIRLTASSGEEIEALVRQPKRLALLAYLSTPEPGSWHRRDILLALFWPDFDSARARTSLRNALYVIRQALGEKALLTRGDEEISVDPALLTTDLAKTWAALRDGRTADALSLYGGELMPGLFPPDSEGFMRWLDTERMKIRVAVCASGISFADLLEKEGKLAEAVATGRRVLEIQPDDETIIRRVMELHEANGDKAGALGLFEAYRARLASDFDAEPSSETLSLAERLRSATPEHPGNRMRGSVTKPAPLVLPGRATDIGEPVKTGTAKRSKHLPVLVAGTLVLPLGFLVWRGDTTERPMSIGTSSTLTADEGLQVQVSLSPN